MPQRNANARWDGSLTGGKGRMAFASGAYEGEFSFASRFEEGEGTNPEELIAAAHAGCFSMQLSGVLGKAGHEPESVETEATVHVNPADGGFAIDRIDLRTKARVPGLSAEEFAAHAETAKRICPVSKALASVGQINLDASLVD